MLLLFVKVLPFFYLCLILKTDKVKAYLESFKSYQPFHTRHTLKIAVNRLLEVQPVRQTHNCLISYIFSDFSKILITYRLRMHQKCMQQMLSSNPIFAR